MMYVFICPSCGRTRMVSLQRKLHCSNCKRAMANCEIDFMDWIELEQEKRDKIIFFYQNIKESELCFFRPMPFYDRWERNYYC